MAHSENEPMTSPEEAELAESPITVERHKDCEQNISCWGQPNGYGALLKFILPLVIVEMCPDVAEQALNRGITSIATDEMIGLLASFGLGYYIVKLLCGSAVEVRQMTVVLVHSKRDYYRMFSLATAVGFFFTIVLIITGLTEAGPWLIRDVHRQSQEVTETTTLMILYLCPAPIIESVAVFHEGGLIQKKYTGYAGAAKLVDFAMQVLFVIVLLFTSTRSDPILIPIFAIYAGFAGRLILDVGFFFVLIWRDLPAEHPTEKPATIRGGLLFWIPLALVRSVQVISRPIINLVVSRTMAEVSVEAAQKALAVMTATYPVGRFLFSWLNDLRAMFPTFYKKQANVKFTVKKLTVFAAGCTLIVFSANGLLFFIPQINFAIMYYAVGLTEELSHMSYIPLVIFSFICLIVGLRAHATSWLLCKKRTLILIPSALVRLATLFVMLFTLPYAGLSGAVLGVTCLLLSFLTEALSVVGAVIFVRSKNPLCGKAQVEKLGLQPHTTVELDALHKDALSTSLQSIQE